MTFPEQLLYTFALLLGVRMAFWREQIALEMLRFGVVIIAWVSMPRHAVLILVINILAELAMYFTHLREARRKKR